MKKKTTIEITGDQLLEIIREHTDGLCKEHMGILYKLITPKQIREIVEACGVTVKL